MQKTSFSESASMHAYTDALERALGTIVGESERQLAAVKAQCEATLAATAARVSEAEARLSAIDARIAARLAEVKDGKDGASITLDDVGPLIQAEIEKAVAALPPAKDGRDGKDGASVTLDDVAPLVAAAVEKAIVVLPQPKDGRDGKDGADGKSISVDDILPLISAETARLFAAVPPPRDGIDGKDGADGKDGVFPQVVPWSDRVFYAGAVCAHEGSTYQALCDTGRSPPHADWICLAARGEDGHEAREITLEGTYDEKKADYRRLSVVALNGAAFIAKRDEPGVCPGDGWQLFAMQGKRGKPGEPGRDGKPGERGEPGPGLIDGGVDGQGLLTLVNGDGSTVAIDLYPLLSKIESGNR